MRMHQNGKFVYSSVLITDPPSIFIVCMCAVVYDTIYINIK